MVINATFNNISATSWWSVLLGEDQLYQDSNNISLLLITTPVLISRAWIPNSPSPFEIKKQGTIKVEILFELSLLSELRPLAARPPHIAMWQTGFASPLHPFLEKSWRVSDCCLTPSEQFFSYIMARTTSFSMRWWWDLLCTKPTRLLDFHSARSLKQQSVDRHVAPLGHISLIPS